MRRSSLLVAAAALLMGALGLALANAPEPNHERTDVAALVDALQQPGEELVVDVRSPGEYRSGHIPGALGIPLDSLPDHLEELESHRGAPLYVICESGHRSARGAWMLADKGFIVYDVPGGMAAWRRAGLPVE